MRADLTEIITALMQSYDEYEEEGIIEAIKSLSTNWPGLTGQERTEISAVVKAFEIMTRDDEEEEDIGYDEQDALSENSTYYHSNSSYPNTMEETQKRGLFRRKKDRH